jgi:hypothetical protein
LSKEWQYLWGKKQWQTASSNPVSMWAATLAPLGGQYQISCGFEQNNPLISYLSVARVNCTQQDTIADGLWTGNTFSWYSCPTLVAYVRTTHMHLPSSHKVPYQLT